ncbi:MurR/RpiR family transcriptional regulator [Clostridium butyricum]|uniref:MurR/RpiR family transcriptional regulator n=1 Tax=Clostridium butyricum TaxID=1492 RepID=UPI00374E8E67
MTHLYLPLNENINFTKNEKIIYDFILSKKENLFLYTEIDISKMTGISQPTVSRFWRKIGYTNLKEFKEAVKDFHNQSSPSTKFKSILDSDEFYYKNYAKKSISLIEDSAEKISESDFNKAVEYFISCDKIFTHGIGPAESLCSLLNFRLNRFGLNIDSINPSGQLLYEDLINIDKDNLIVLFLFSHYHPETHVILDYATEINCKVIIITDILIKPFNNHNIITFYVSRGELLEFHSLVGPLFFIESLIVAIGISKSNEPLEKLHKLEELRKKYESFIPRTVK